jgi:Ca2+/Na+ antiporter
MEYGKASLTERDEIKNKEEIQSWNWRLWLWVLLCSLALFATVPVARGLQRYIYSTIGREFFTYFVLFVVVMVFITFLYFFIFKLKVKKISQYVWLSLCAGLYIYFSIQLKEHPEEAIHFLEYGLLSYFLFKALHYRIHDWTVYLSAAMFAFLIGTLDEFFQWVMPQRFWDFRDVGFNGLAGGIFLLAIGKGIRPKTVCEPIKRFSVTMLVGIITVNLIVFGLCLSNTPGIVKSYTDIFKSLDWLQQEEPMIEYGYEHKDPETGTFYSRFTLEELRATDFEQSKSYGPILALEINSEKTLEELTEIYSPSINPFLHELLIHIFRRDENAKVIEQIKDPTEKIKKGNTTFRENVILEQYFGNTLQHSGLVWPDEKIKDLERTAFLWKEPYISRTGKIVTLFGFKAALTVIVLLLIAVQVSGKMWRNRLNR